MAKQNPMGVLWERLGAADPGEVAQRAVAPWRAEKQAYVVRLLNADLCVSPAQRRVDGPDGAAGFEAMLVCVQYLLTSRDEPPAGEMVNPRALPYGDLFFRGLHELPTAKLEGAFGERLDAFRAAAEGLDGEARDMGDAAYEFRPLPRVPMTVRLWAADDEFPARAQFLFDKAADRQLPIDALWVLAKIVAKRLTAAAG